VIGIVRDKAAGEAEQPSKALTGPASPRRVVCFLPGDFHRHRQTLLVCGSGLAVRSPLRFLISFASRDNM
jgi:hypothetical protein